MSGLDVSLEVVLSREFLSTQLTSERPLLSVGSDVSPEVTRVRKILATVRTDLVLFSPHKILVVLQPIIFVSPSLLMLHVIVSDVLHFYLLVVPGVRSLLTPLLVGGVGGLSSSLASLRL